MVLITDSACVYEFSGVFRHCWCICIPTYIWDFYWWCLSGRGVYLECVSRWGGVVVGYVQRAWLDSRYSDYPLKRSVLHVDRSCVCICECNCYSWVITVMTHCHMLCWHGLPTQHCCIVSNRLGKQSYYTGNGMYQGEGILRPLVFQLSSSLLFSSFPCCFTLSIHCDASGKRRCIPL